MTQFNDIHLKIPDLWSDETSITLCGERGGSFTPNVLIGKSNLEDGITLPEFASFTGDHLAATLGESGLVIVAEALIELDKKEAFQRIYQFKIDDEGKQIVQQIQILQIRGRKAVSITFTDLVENFGASMPKATRTIMESFHWEDGEHDHKHD